MDELGRPIRALGLMSGTSLDGIDAAELVTDGVSITAFGPSRFEPYPADTAATLRGQLGAMPGAAGLDHAAALLDEAHAAVASAFQGAEVVGYHGQTLSHAPDRFQTFQLGDGARLARALRRPVVWDFRTADVLSGGEGAPLVPVFHLALARHAGLEETVAFLNIGGVANVTWVDPAERDICRALLAFDTGPGNALINDLMRARAGRELDRDGALAAEGRVDEAFVAQVLARDYFARVPPKSLDRNDFRDLLAALDNHSTSDAVATLTALTAASIAAAVRHMPEPPSRWLVAGGGRLNATMMRMIAARTNAPVDPVEVLGLDGDMLEAQAFAYLAVRVMRGLPTSLPTTTGARMPVCGGRISEPI